MCTVSPDTVEEVVVKSLSLNLTLTRLFTSCPAIPTIMCNLLLSVPDVSMCRTIPPTLLVPYNICRGAVGERVVVLVPKLSLKASIPFGVPAIKPVKRVVANVIAAIAPALAMPANNVGARTPPVATTTKTTNAATTAAFIALGIYSPHLYC